MVEKSQKLPPKMKAFLAAYRETCSITRAAEAAGISRWAHYRAVERCEPYRLAFEEADEEAVGALIDEAVRRGKEGVRRYVLYHGKPVMVAMDPTKRTGKKNPKVALVESEYDTTLLAMILKAKKPEVFRENVRAELTGKNGGPLVITVRRMDKSNA